MSQETASKTCEGCGAQINSDDIIERRAGLVAGTLLCAQCVDRKRNELLQARNAALSAQSPASDTTPTDAPPPGAGGSQGTVWMPPVEDGQKDIADEKLSLVGDHEIGQGGSTQIRSFAQGSTLAGEHRDGDFKRPLSGPNEPATRVRTFHGKLTAAGLAHMDEQINEWLDSHPNLFVKSSSASVGLFEGKTKEPHLLLTLFY